MSIPQPQLTLVVQAVYLEHLRSGLKTHEGRLARLRYLALKPGDLITVQASAPSQASSESEDAVDSSLFRVRKVIQYKSFRDMLMTHGVGAFLPGRDEEDVEGAVDVYRAFPGYADGENEMGAVAIEIERLDRHENT